jgi:tetratricopeptide (TPR) repeat protein
MEFTFGTRMINNLLDDPNWRLIYFSDHLQILLKNDGQNQKVWDSFSMTATTPYRLKPYRQGLEKKAETEYLQMIQTQDSGMARVGLAQIYLDTKQLDKAKANFEKATNLNPKLGSAYLGLGKIALMENKKDQAIKLFNKSLELSPYLGESYLNLGTTYLQTGQNSKAKDIFKAGLEQNIDLISRQKIIQAIAKTN